MTRSLNSLEQHALAFGRQKKMAVLSLRPHQLIKQLKSIVEKSVSVLLAKQ